MDKKTDLQELAKRTFGKATQSQRGGFIRYCIAASFFLAASDVLTHGPSVASLFSSIYSSGADFNATVLGFLGCLIGAIVLFFFPRFFAQHRNQVIFASIVISILSILLRYYTLEFSPFLCTVGVFIGGMLLPFSKVLFFYGMSLFRNVVLFVLPASIGMVGKVIISTLLASTEPETQFLILVLAMIACVVSFGICMFLEKGLRIEDTSKLITRVDQTWGSLIALIAMITLISGFFRVFSTIDTLPSDYPSFLLETAMCILIPLAPCYILAWSDAPNNARIRNCLILLSLGLLIIMGQSTSTWALSPQVNRQIVHFFRNFSILICWVAIFAATWTEQKNALRVFAIAVMVFCIASVIWYFVMQVASKFMSLLIGVLIYCCILVGDRLIPKTSISNTENLREATELKLREMAESYDLSARETEIFVLLAQGRSRATIASRLYISEGTVKSHIGRIYHKLNVVGKDELLAMVQTYEELH